MLRSYQFKNKTKSVTRTVRIDEDIDYQLEKLAHEQRVSVNYFANQALRKFVEWDVFADRLGFVTLPSDIFEKLVGFVTDEQAKELGGWFGKRSEEHTSELQSHSDLVCRLLLEKKNDCHYPRRSRFARIVS